ncbi:MAG TPA: TonB-dependent receptor [Thermoanaerobaculia bacterium]
MRRLFSVFVIGLLLPCIAFAQSIPTATITGKVTTEGSGLPGVTVTVRSPNLQGTRTAITSSAGDYIVPLLPPGEYAVTFELEGMQKVTRQLTLTAARTDRIDIALRPAAVAESITVTASAPSAIESTQVSTNFKQDLVEQLPVPRTLHAVTLLAPGTNDNGPKIAGDPLRSGIMISGAMSYDSLYLVNGAVVNENLRGQAHTLFIEDAIQETTVLTGGVPAEFGHFTGGVVNMITKSGGNDFRGSFRTSLSNEKWIAKTPLTADQEDKISPVYEATLGGPFLRDRLWFFGAGRSAKTDDIRQTVPGLARQGDQDANGNPIPVGTPLTPLTYPHATKQTRLEGKLTGSVTSKQALVASFLNVQDKETNQTAQVIMDLDSLVPERELPNSILAVNYNGVMTNRFFLEGQYSKKKFKFVGSGSSFYDIIKGTLITDRARGTRFWSPTFRKTPEGERRDIRDYTLKGTYFLSTPNIGAHEIKAGYEDFNEVRAVNNYQNGSDYRISVASTIVRGNQIFPRMAGGSTGTLTRISWLPIFVLSKGSDYTTKSAYLQDQWALNSHWNFNVGARWDKNDALSGAHTFKIADDSAISPRVSAHYDIFGNGRIIVNGSYGHYVGRLAEGAANDADPAGRNASLQWNYQGPNINNDVNAPTNSLIPTDKAIQMIFDWFFANGGTNRRPFRTTPSIPGVESILDVDNMRSPMVREWTIGAGTTIGTRGYARADFVKRSWENFYTSYRDLGTGKATDQFGTQYDLSIIRSDNGEYSRDYNAVQTQFNYRVMQRLNLGGTYTWSRLTGNVTGEDTGSGPLVGGAGEYPEYRMESWNFPTGYLTGDERHRAKVWASYDVPMPVGGLNVSVLQNYDAGLRSSDDGVIDTRPYVTNPGYLTPPATVTYYFGSRGNLKSDNITRTDLALNFKMKLFSGVEFYLQPEVTNLFNEQGVVSFDEEVLTAVDCPAPAAGAPNLQAPCPARGLAPFNPFTTKPVQDVNYIHGPNFGKPAGENDYQTPRTFRFSLGIRF